MYYVHTPATANNKADSAMVVAYHDETKDDGDDATTYIGTAADLSENLDVTALRLSIRGYVANVGHEANQVVRGDETVEGAELTLYAYDKKLRPLMTRSRARTKRRALP